ncbi:MAG: hypothetical protein K6T90_12280 [Leptolyngbyaceae cyanobacterium HOT.MB2.61]|nr:hypothetical protein [Leptolyngbyaceae cyanobacterium HOT.MB2.61]
MKFNRQEFAPIRGIRQRPRSLMILYILIGLSGMGLSWILNANPVVETFFLLLSGFAVGMTAEKLLKKPPR